jgi:autotransporter-associated beta strand protein
LQNAFFNSVPPNTDLLTGTYSGFRAAVTNVDFASANDPANPFEAVGAQGANNIYARFVGLLRVTAAGNYTFATRSDDGTNLYINGQLVVNNNFYQGPTTRTGTIALAANTTYLIETNYYEGGGGAGFMLGYQGPDRPAGTPDITAANNDGDFAQYVIPGSRLFAIQSRVDIGNNVNVTANSTITADGMLQAVMGNLSMDRGTTLTLGGTVNQAPGSVLFNQTTLNPAGTGTTFTFNTASLGDISAGTIINNSGAAATIVKQGAQNLILNSATAPTLGPGVSYEIQAGRISARVGGAATTFSALGATTTVTFNGAGTALLLRAQNTNADLPGLALAVGADGGILETASINGTARTYTIGGASAGVTLSGGGTLTVSPIATNSNITLAGVISGTGNIRLTRGGNLTLGGLNTYTGQTRASAGTIIGTSASSFGNPAGNVLIDGGTVGLQGNFVYSPAPPITINSGSLAGISGNNTYGGTVTLGAASTIRSNTGGDTFTITGSVTRGANALTIAGAGNTTLSGVIDGSGALTKNDGGTLTLGGANTLTGAVTINGGVVRVTNPTGLGSGNVTVNGNGTILRFDTGTGNTASTTATSVNVTGTGRVETTSGSANLSAATINLGSSIRSGLLEGHAETTTRPRTVGTGVVPGVTITGNTNGVRMGQAGFGGSAAYNGNDNIWASNQMWVYTGQVQANGTTMSFAENIDDDVWIRVNGQTILDDQAWNVPVKGTITGLTAGQWYDIEIRLWNGGGGAGPVTGSGWTLANPGYGFGAADTDTGTNVDGSAYFKPGEAAASGGSTLVDPLGVNRFRTLGNPAGAIQVNGGTTLQARQVLGEGAITVMGTAASPGILHLVDQGAATASAAASLSLTGTDAAGRVTLGNNQTLAVQKVNVAAGGTLTQTGTGRLLVNGVTDTGNTGTVRVEGGALGGTGTLGPAGATTTSLVVANGGRVAPGNATLDGNLTVQGNTSIENGAMLDVGMPGTPTGAPNARNRLVTSGNLVGNGGTLTIRLFGDATSGYSPLTPVTFVVETHAATTGTMPAVVVDTSNFTSSIAGIPGFTATGIINAGDIQITVTPVPEPGSILLMAAGAMGAVGFVRRRMRRPAVTA